MTQSLISSRSIPAPRGRQSRAPKADDTKYWAAVVENDVKWLLGWAGDRFDKALDSGVSLMANPLVQLLAVNMAIEYIEQWPNKLFGMTAPTTWPGVLRATVNTGAVVNTLSSSANTLLPLLLKAGAK